MTATTEDKETATEAAFGVAGMDCASCVAHVEKAVQRVGGLERLVEFVRLNRTGVS